MSSESSLRIIIQWMMKNISALFQILPYFQFNYKVSELESNKNICKNVFMYIVVIAHGTFVFPCELFKKSLTSNMTLEITTICWMGKKYK
jgi:hypothetical protein